MVCVMDKILKPHDEAIKEILMALAEEAANIATEEHKRQVAISERLNLPPGGFVPGMTVPDGRSITVVVKSDIIAPNEIIKQETR